MGLLTWVKGILALHEWRHITTITTTIPMLRFQLGLCLFATSQSLRLVDQMGITLKYLLLRQRIFSLPTINSLKGCTSIILLGGITPSLHITERGIYLLQDGFTYSS